MNRKTLGLAGIAALATQLLAAGDAGARGQDLDPDRLLAPSGVAAIATTRPAKPRDPDALIAPSGVASLDEPRAPTKPPVHPDDLMAPAPERHRHSRRSAR